MNLYQNLLNIRKIAIVNHFSDDIEKYVEKCYRYVSKTYHINLDELKSVKTPEEVALIFMEDELEDWTIEEIEKVKELLDTSDKPILQSGMIESDSELSDDEWILQQEAVAKKEEEKKRKQQEDIARKTHDAIQQLTQSFNGLNKALDKKEDE